MISLILSKIFRLACFTLLSLSVLTAKADCGLFSPKVKFFDGGTSCYSDISFLTRTGVAEQDKNISLISVISNNYQNFAIATTADPQSCPFVQSTQWRQDPSDTASLVKNICEERLKTKISQIGKSNTNATCNCQVILSSGNSPLTKTEFELRTDLYNQQVAKNYKYLREEVAIVSAKPEPIKVIPPLFKEDNNQKQIDYLNKYTDKVALVIGNKNYKQGPLKNPINDARAIRTKLKQIGFKVAYYEDVKVSQISDIMAETQKMIKPGSVFVFFYAGHGYQLKDENYFPVTDATIRTVYDVPNQSISLHGLLAVTKEAQSSLNLILLDACRNNPFIIASRGGEQGLAKVTPAFGTLIYYATRPGAIASDGEGENGLYTKHLLQHIDEPNLPIERFFKKVTEDVIEESNEQQIPWSEGFIRGDFAFVSK